MRKIIFLFLLGLLFPAGTQASEEVGKAVAIPYYTDSSVSPQNCKLTETNSLGINFNNVPIEISKAKAFVDEKIAEIESLAKTAGLQKIEMQNMNYNVYANNYGGGGCGVTNPPATYMLSGSIGYLIDDASKVGELIKALESKGYQINFSSNVYRQCQ